MLKLILILRSVLWSQTFLVRRTRFLSVKITIYLFFNYYPMENRLEQRYFLKKSYVWATWSFYINPVYNKEIPDLSRSYLKFFPTFYRTNNNKANQDHWSNCDLYWSYAYELTWQNQSIRRHRFGLSGHDLIYCTRKTFLPKSKKQWDFCSLNEKVFCRKGFGYSKKNRFPKLSDMYLCKRSLLRFYI